MKSPQRPQSIMKTKPPLFAGMPTGKALALNVVMLGLIGAAAVVFVRSYVLPEEVPNCLNNYSQGMRISLTKAGAPMSASDLQARFTSDRAWGLEGRATVVKIKPDAPDVALEIKPGLPAVKTAATGEIDAQRAGVGFQWSPQSMRNASAACLVYSVNIPEGFDLGSLGRLPGLFGVSSADVDIEDSSKPPVNQPSTAKQLSEDERTYFSAAPGWSGPQHLGELAATIRGKNLTAAGSARRGFTINRGGWSTIVQEMVLNDPGQENGLVRIWLNDRLVLESSGIQFRNNAKDSIKGVVADTFVAEQHASAKPDQQKVLITPFELRWK